MNMLKAAKVLVSGLDETARCGLTERGKGEFRADRKAIQPHEFEI